MLAKNVLDSAHLAGKLAWRPVGEFLEVPIEVSLVGVPELVRQIGQALVRVWRVCASGGAAQRSAHAAAQAPSIR